MFSFVGLLPFLHPELLFFFAILLASKTDLEGSFFRGYVEVLPKNAHLPASVIFLPGANRGCIGTYEPNETTVPVYVWLHAKSVLLVSDVVVWGVIGF